MQLLRWCSLVGVLLWCTLMYLRCHGLGIGGESGKKGLLRGVDTAIFTMPQANSWLLECTGVAKSKRPSLGAMCAYSR